MKRIYSITLISIILITSSTVSIIELFPTTHHTLEESITTKGQTHISSVTNAWVPNGTVICRGDWEQWDPQICSDGAGGAIITWEDWRAGYNAYAQRIDSNGIIQWTSGGVDLCNGSNNQGNPQICSDGSGGAIITWRDGRGGFTDIYAQRVDSDGIVQWSSDGLAICTVAYGQWYPQICSDGAEGAIIAWTDERNGYIDIYAQKVNSSGIVQWTTNGVAICTGKDDRDPIFMDYYLQICSDGAGGAIITWSDPRDSGLSGDLFAQRINSDGNVQWTANGTAICTAINTQNLPQICSDGAGGAVITWKDYRSGSHWDIYAQKIDLNGNVLWTANGTAICTASNDQDQAQLCIDGTGGAIITWRDYRSDSYADIYAQKVNSLGNVQWSANGVAICTAFSVQKEPQICSDGAGGAFITWRDFRDRMYIYIQRVSLTGNLMWSIDGVPVTTEKADAYWPQICSDGSDGAIVTWYHWRLVDTGLYHNIYALRIKSAFPTSNHPENIVSFRYGSETIDWILYDDFDGGQYRIIANNSYGNYYVWMNWTSWTNNTPYYIPINRTAPGVYNYTIEYDDSHGQNGLRDTVIVILNNDEVPTSNHPADIITNIDGSETIDWILYDDYGEGNYRILANNSQGNVYVWVDWTSWTNNTPIYVPINRTIHGIYNYTIEYYDDRDQFGIPDTIIVIIQPLSQQKENGVGAIPFGNIYLIFLFVGVGVVYFVFKEKSRTSINSNYNSKSKL